MTKTALRPADRVRRELHDQPRPDRRPDLYAAEQLAELGAATNLSADALTYVAALDDALAGAAAAVVRLENAAADARTEQHAAARGVLTAYLAALHEDSADDASVVHRDDCADTGALEIADHYAETRYGRCRVRVARCIACGAQAVANRRIEIPADPAAVEQQRKREASSHGTAGRTIPKRASKFA